MIFSGFLLNSIESNGHHKADFSIFSDSELSSQTFSCQMLPDYVFSPWEVMPATKGATAGAGAGKEGSATGRQLRLRLESRVSRGFECGTRTRPVLCWSAGVVEEESQGQRSCAAPLGAAREGPGQPTSTRDVLPLAARCSWFVFFLDWKIRIPRPGSTLLTHRGN